MRRLLITLLLVLFIQIGNTQALNTIDSQKEMFITIEAGRTYKFPLLLENIQSADLGKTITTTGEISSWITYGASNEASYTLNAFVTALPVTITIPDSVGVGEYAGEIKHDGTAISKVTISVTISAEKIKILQAVANVSSEISELETKLNDILAGKVSSIEGQINTIKEDLSSAIKSVIDYQANVAELEKENEELKQKVSELEFNLLGIEQQKSELELTGNVLRGNSPIIFVLGAILGAGLVYVFTRQRKKKF